MNRDKTLRDMLVDEVRDLYDAERQLTKALPTLVRAASDDELRSALETHLTKTEGHVERLEQVFGMLDEKVKGKHCAGMSGIVEEGGQLLDELEKGPLLDACLIAAGQRAEHYEIAAYGSAIAWAHVVGEPEVAGILEQTLDEEKIADRMLSELAEQGLNATAAGGDVGEDDVREGLRVAVGPSSGRKSQAAPPKRR
jgi:ferritin-like metal-binding protein YciE